MCLFNDSIPRDIVVVLLYDFRKKPMLCVLVCGSLLLALSCFYKHADMPRIYTNIITKEDVTICNNQVQRD